MDIVNDIASMTDFKRDSAKMIAQIKKTGQPKVLTVNGKASAVVMDAMTWEEIQKQLDYAETVAGIRKGLSQARADKSTEAKDVFDRLANKK